jgi:hypothetical protein
MKLFFEQIEDKYIKNVFYDFYCKNFIFFEIISNNIAIGFYGIKTITESVCEISLHIYEKFRGKLTKQITLKCLSFPFSLGFKKIIITTELEKMRRFLCKLAKYGVKYLFKHNNLYLFEVSDE